jgi:hypothetical protein
MRSILVAVCLAAVAATMGCQAAMKWDMASRGEASAAERPGADRGAAGGATGEGAVPAKAPDMTVLNAPGPSPVAAIEPRKVIYTASLAVLVGDVGAAVEKTRALAETLGGYMDRMTRTGITIRVPSPRFNDAIAAVSEMGTVTSRDIKAQDVTEEYVDLAIRLKSAKALHEKLLELLGKAATVKESLDVEQEISRVRTEIELLEGKINRLTSQVNYSTITVEFAPTKEAPAAMRTVLPFPWLNELGIDQLLSIIRR